MAKTADRLLEGIKRRGQIAATANNLDDDDILAVADDVIETRLVPMLITLRQDYFVTSVDRATVADQAAYTIPARAVMRTLRDLKLRDSSDSTRDLRRVTPEDCHRYPSGEFPHAFYLKGDQYVIVPPPTSTNYTLEEWYELRPNRLVKLARAAQVASFTATTVTVTTAPTTITTGVVVDFVSGTSGCRTLAMDKTVTNVASTVYSFAAGDIPSTLAVGDYVSVYGTAPVVQLPDECSALVETIATQRLLRALGDFEGANALSDERSDEEKFIKSIGEPRVQGEQTIILNRAGLLRGGRGRRRVGPFF